MKKSNLFPWVDQMQSKPWYAVVWWVLFIVVAAVLLFFGQKMGMRLGRLLVFVGFSCYVWISVVVGIWTNRWFFGRALTGYRSSIALLPSLFMGGAFQDFGPLWFLPAILISLGFSYALYTVMAAFAKIN